MSVERCNGRYFLLALSSLAMAACGSSSAAPTTNAAAAAPVVAAAAVTTAPLVTGLPDFTALVERYGPAVVNVQVTEKRAARGARGFPIPGMPQDEDEEEADGEGSGFIVSADGYVLTNRHVVVDASKVVIKLMDRREYEAKVVGMDELTDVAVLKIEGSNLPTVRIGNPDQLRPGQWVVAIGSPFGMENSVTAGIVSATSRNLPQEPLLVPFIQTDVAVNPGNSGGPLFNLNGEVVGINSQIFSRSGGYQGMSFAIPIDIADNVRVQLVSNGKVTRGFLGVSLAKMNAAYAETFGLDRPHGALVGDVTKGQAAEKAGILPTDIILSVGGKAVEYETLAATVAAIKPGTNTEIELWSKGKARKVTVKVGDREEGASAALVPGNRNSGERGRGADVEDVLGLRVRPLTSQEREATGTDGRVVVEDVAPAARRSGIQPGDIILSVASTSVGSLAELNAAIGRSTGRVVVLRVERPGQGVRFVQIPRE